MKLKWIGLLMILLIGACKDDTADPVVAQETLGNQPSGIVTAGSNSPGSKDEDAKQTGLEWYSYQEGVAVGKNQNKKILVTFYANWCRYCVQMDRETFKNSEVANYLKSNFISIRVDSENDPKTAALYNVRGIPVTWFLAENGENIGSQPGFIPPDRMMILLKFIQTDSYKRMSYTEFLQKM